MNENKMSIHLDEIKEEYLLSVSYLLRNNFSFNQNDGYSYNEFLEFKTIYKKEVAFTKVISLFKGIFKNQNSINNFKLLINRNFVIDKIEFKSSKVENSMTETEIIRLMLVLHNYNVLNLIEWRNQIINRKTKIYKDSIVDKKFRVDSKDIFMFFNFKNNTKSILEDIYKEDKYIYKIENDLNGNQVKYIIKKNIILIQNIYYNYQLSNYKNHKKIYNLISFLEENSYNKILNIK